MEHLLDCPLTQYVPPDVQSTHDSSTAMQSLKRKQLPLNPS